MNVYSINLNAVGASDDPDVAYDRAAERLEMAARKIRGRQLPTDPGVAVKSFDPGGGPCRPLKINVSVVIDQDVLPEAQSNDDD